MSGDLLNIYAQLCKDAGESMNDKLASVLRQSALNLPGESEYRIGSLDEEIAYYERRRARSLGSESAVDKE